MKTIIGCIMDAIGLLIIWVFAIYGLPFLAAVIRGG